LRRIWQLLRARWEIGSISSSHIHCSYHPRKIWGLRGHTDPGLDTFVLYTVSVFQPCMDGELRLPPFGPEIFFVLCFFICHPSVFIKVSNVLRGFETGPQGWVLSDGLFGPPMFFRGRMRSFPPRNYPVWSYTSSNIP
jgi:hypothetical protein